MLLWLIRHRAAAFLAALLAVVATPALAAAPPDVVSSEYRLPARVDPDVAEGVATEVWARVYRPRRLDGGPRPLVLLLHGNHATCGRFDEALGVRVDDDVTYTFEGRCPKGRVVVPNHRGFDYLGEGLAAAGFVAVSINANRGVTGAPGVEGDEGLNLRRGRLVLRHLALLARWARRGGTPASLGVDLRGGLDLSRVGLAGHSRGGEGMRAALAQLRDEGSPWPARVGGPGTAIRAVYEIAPVDGQTSRTLDALGVAWNALLPYCDGDVFDLQGVRILDRMLREPREPARLPKSTFAVWGANHSFYNAEWLQSESPGCAGHEALFPQVGGSEAQRATALASLVPFMRAHVADGGDDRRPPPATPLNPDLPLPAGLAGVTPIDRGYTDTPDRGIELRIEDFDRPTGTGSSGLPTLARAVAVEHVTPFEHDPVQRAAAIDWSGGGRHLFQTNLASRGRGRDAAGLETLEFRVSRRCGEACDRPSPLNPRDATDFSVQLVRGDGSLSRPVRLSAYHALRGPVGLGADGFAVLHPILATARIPLDAFGLGPRPSIGGVRFTFDRTPTGAIYLANVRLSKRGAADDATAAAAPASPRTASAGDEEEGTGGAAPAAGGAGIVAIRPAPRGSFPVSGGPARGAVEVEIEASGPMPVTDALPALTVGGRRFTRGRFGPGTTDRIVFTLDGASFAGLPDGAEAELRLGAVRRLTLGRLDKAMLR